MLGGVLAAVLVGPWAGCLCVAVMLMVQSLFAAGRLTGLIRGHRPPRQPA